MSAIVQVAHEVRLIDRHDRPEAHRDGWELPELRHEPRMRIRRNAFTIDFLAETFELRFGNAAFEECTRINAGRTVALEEDHVAAEVFRRCTEEVIRADVVERRSRSECCNVAAEFGTILVCTHDHRHRIPTHVVAQTRFEFGITGKRRLLLDRNRVEIRRLETKRHVRAAALRFLDEIFEQSARAIRPFDRDDSAHRFEPLLGLLRIRIVSHRPLPFRNWRGFLAGGTIQLHIRSDPNNRANRG